MRPSGSRLAVFLVEVSLTRHFLIDEKQVGQEWYELGIDPTDWGIPARKPDESSEPVAILQFPG
jgi:hypothetical protein